VQLNKNTFRTFWHSPLNTYSFLLHFDSLLNPCIWNQNY